MDNAAHSFPGATRQGPFQMYRHKACFRDQKAPRDPKDPPPDSVGPKAAFRGAADDGGKGLGDRPTVSHRETRTGRAAHEDWVTHRDEQVRIRGWNYSCAAAGSQSNGAAGVQRKVWRVLTAFLILFQ